METYLDYKILIDFLKQMPSVKDISKKTDNDYEEEKIWNSFWEFLRKGCDLNLINCDESKYDNLITIFTSGRNGTLYRELNRDKFIEINKIRQKKAFRIFFLDEEAKSILNEFEQIVGYAIGGLDDYIEIWKKLSISKKFSLRDGAKCKLEKWEDIAFCFFELTDLLIIDSFLLENSDFFPFNLFRIIELACCNNESAKNIVIISYYDYSYKNKYPDFNHLKRKYNEIQEFIRNKDYKVNLSMIIFDKYIKEHDRYLISNYFRIKSGDSFTFFKSNGDMATNGTDVEIDPLTDQNVFEIVKDLLTDMQKRINATLESDSCKSKRHQYLLGEKISNLINLAK